MSRHSYNDGMADRDSGGSGAAVGAECEIRVVNHKAVDQVRAGLAGESRLKALADVFGALGDPTRLRILLCLRQQPLCVCDLAAAVGVSESAVSHQLRLLRNLDLVAFRREGRRVVYRLSDAHVEALLGQGMEHAEERIGGGAG